MSDFDNVVNMKNDFGFEKGNISYGLSNAQQQMYFLQQVNPNDISLNDVTVLKIKGNLDYDLLEEDLNIVFHQNEQLQSRYTIINNDIVRLPTENHQIHIRSLPKHLSLTECLELCNQPFRLDSGPLYRVSILEISDEESILIICIHHIVFDGWSKMILLGQIKSVYEKLIEHRSVLYEKAGIKQYKDYISAQNEWLETDLFKDKLQQLTEYLRDIPKLNLPYENSGIDKLGTKGSFESVVIDADLLIEIKRLSRKEHVSLFVFFISLFVMLIYRYTDQTDIVMGVPFAGREDADFDSVIGLFVNTLIMRVQFNRQISFRELMKIVKKESIRMMKYRNVPFNKLIQQINPERRDVYYSIYQLMFTYQNFSMPINTIADMEVESLTVDCGFAQSELSVTFWEHGEQLQGTFEYNTELFNSFTIQQMVRCFKNLLKQVYLDIEKPIELYHLLDQNDIALLERFSNGIYKDEYIPTIYELFQNCVTIHKKDIAVICKDIMYSYEDLNQKVNEMYSLFEQQNIKKKSIIGVYMNFSYEFIYCVLAILQYGCCYVPIDPEYPVDRVELIMNDTKMETFLCHYEMIDSINTLTGFSETRTDDVIVKRMKNKNEDILGDSETIDSLTCIIYTSGTSGVPKGVMLENHNIINLVYSFIESYNPTVKDRILPLSPVGSSSLVGEMLPTLLSGGAIVVSEKKDFLNLDNLSQLIRKYEVTILSTVPSMMTQLNAENESFNSIRLYLCGGERLSAQDIDDIARRSVVVNGYGLTEGTICSTYYKVTPSNIPTSVIPIGKPIRNTSIYVLSADLQYTPVFCEGDIYISGSGVARGYLKDVEKTSKTFIDNPFQPGTKLLKTGDKGKWDCEGNLIYIGRSDDQVQIRGNRVELDEIATVIRGYENIEDVVVITSEPEERDIRLVAFYTMKEGTDLQYDDLFEWTKSKLPSYMVPSYYHRLYDIPLNMNGKVDIQKLPKVALSRDNLSTIFELPTTPTEEMIASIWKKHLCIDKVGVHDNFFDLGGHSILLTKICNELNEFYEKKINIVDLFKYTTIRNLADYLDAREQKNEIEDALIERAKKQRQMYFGKKR